MLSNISVIELPRESLNFRDNICEAHNLCNIVNRYIGSKITDSLIQEIRYRLSGYLKTYLYEYNILSSGWEVEVQLTEDLNTISALIVNRQFPLSPPIFVKDYDCCNCAEYRFKNILK